MSKSLHIKPKEPLAEGQKWNTGAGCLTLSKAGMFTVEIVQTDDLYKDGPKKLPPFNRLTQEQVWEIKDYDNRYWVVQAHNKRDKEEAEYNKQKEVFNKKLEAELNRMSWCWQAVGKGMAGKAMTHNASFSIGLPHSLSKQIRFPKLLEGRGPAWLEVFTQNDPATGEIPHGIFVNAIGTPKVIAAEWRDYTGRKITEEIAFGSTVYLHIYTEALYGQNIKIQLADDGFFTDTNLTPTPSDKDGNPIQKLDPKALTEFTRLVNIHKYNTITKPPEGAIVDAIVTDKGKEQTSSANVQKCVFPIFIEHAWQFQAAGSFNSGTKLSLKPIIHHPKIEKQEKDLDNCILKISRNGILMQGELSGNNPLVLGEKEEKTGVPDDQKKIDFTFGVFIDGTNNNRYDTIARTDWEEKRIGRIATDNNPYTNEERLNVYAKSNDDLTKKDKIKYKYGEGSYENDLSNVAILFDNYIEDKESRTFKIYTEGMNTNTLGDENLNVSEYETDDFFMGGAFGAGNSGIVDRVRRAIEQMTQKIMPIMAKQENKKIDSITIDVFGFSRGAASARHFVHEITLPSYYTEVNRDRYGRNIDVKYANTRMPSNGHFGYLLTEKGITFNRLIIRFAGLYDTVAHHGLVQFNDIKDLGLNSISKAKHVIHMVAAEEHRKNFSLSPIIKSQNHVELYMPGVHCDVGGSYPEGRPEGIAHGVAPDPDGEHVLATDYCDNTFASSRLSKFRDILIDEGWFTKDQITICDAYGKPHKTNYSANSLYDTQKLISQRAYISNQYSFIPLHMIKQFAEKQNIKFNNTTMSKYVFTQNIFTDNIDFLNKIKKYIEDYAAEAIANPLDVINHKIPDADLKQLRNHYLHYNATATLVNAPEPERKRFIVKH
ncbi:phospholipase effector Tle1 domain-containing protein [Flavobacterium aquidurense]|uniref:phospholipase effector Tle1 domain-containing protein n=1 Tax=Flavobacterium aquidurense TaxID=362413 RepID=UPI00286799FD|nr:DUF2235 domain-containing protein [Flavobacterium aquidurense]MDR7369755.1 hypothetical protein [Flavobacterium aquidurense]